MRTGAASREDVDRQLDVLTHRGPDARGVYMHERAGIGQTRLAVLDLRTGDPPLTDESGDIGVVLNGEIYNFAELRDKLLAGGHQLQTTGDTEVIAHLAETMEPAQLASCLHGMFAIAVWDARREQLVLLRDRFGKKPLYYWWDGNGTFVFASEIKALLVHPSVPRRLDTSALDAYLTFGYVPTPRTMFAGIRALPPASVLVLKRDSEPVERTYWEPPVPGLAGVDHLAVDAREAAKGVASGLRAAVRRRLKSDVPLGAFLSGGIDSSAVVACMAEAHPAVRTFSIGFEDQDGYDERPFARLVAKHFGTDHTEFVVKPEAVDLVDRLVWHHDQPFGDSSAIPTFLLAELTRRHVTVALSGDGGDELFAGYERFAAGVASVALARLPSAVRRAALGAAMPAAALHPALGGKLRRFLGRADAGMPAAYREWVSYVPTGWLERLRPGADPWALEHYDRLWQATDGAHPLDRLLSLNLRTYLLDDLLPKVDRMSMAHGLEVRSPFLDHEFADYALRLRPELKRRGLSLKRVLKQAFQGVLPDEILRRGKRGFGVPLDRWFREDLAAYATDALCSERSRIAHFLDRGAIQELMNDHVAGRAQNAQPLWTLLTLEVFLRRHDW